MLIPTDQAIALAAWMRLLIISMALFIPASMNQITQFITHFAIAQTQSNMAVNAQRTSSLLVLNMFMTKFTAAVIIPISSCRTSVNAAFINARVVVNIDLTTFHRVVHIVVITNM